MQLIKHTPARLVIAASAMALAFLSVVAFKRMPNDMACSGLTMAPPPNQPAQVYYKVDPINCPNANAKYGVWHQGWTVYLDAGGVDYYHLDFNNFFGPCTSKQGQAQDFLTPNCD